MDGRGIEWERGARKSGPEIHLYFRVALKKWSINTPIFQGYPEKVCYYQPYISGVDNSHLGARKSGPEIHLYFRGTLKK